MRSNPIRATLRKGRSEPRGAPGARVRGILQRVVELRERQRQPEGRGDEPVGEPGVLGQQGPVEVRADDGSAQNALEPGVARVAVPAQDAAERLLARAEVRAAAVV